MGCDDFQVVHYFWTLETEFRSWHLLDVGGLDRHQHISSPTSVTNIEAAELNEMKVSLSKSDDSKHPPINKNPFFDS